MGFYGNITNTSKTTFSFDKIYANRLEMDNACANGDGVFLGRYVLVEYGYIFDATDEAWTDERVGMSNITTIYDHPTDRSNLHVISWVENKLVKIKYNSTRYYKYKASIISGKPVWHLMRGTYDTSVKDDDLYEVNYKIDRDVYHRGYDSTVWIKQFINNEEKYIQIAELNTVIPVFNLEPIMPYDPYSPVEITIDTYQPNIYYYFNGSEYVISTDNYVAGRQYYVAHTVADGEGEGNRYEIPYAKINSEDSNNISYNIQVPTNYVLNLDPNNINFNLAGFDPNAHNYSSDSDEIKYIYGSTGYPYYKNPETGMAGNDLEPNTCNDVKSLIINLPGLGNAACRVYDLLYGEERQLNYRIDNVSGALNRLNKKLNSINLEANKLLYTSPEVDNDTGDKIIKSAEIFGDNWINYKVTNDTDNKLTQFKLSHTPIELDNKIIAPNANQTPKFGETIEIPSFTVDDCGHVVSQSETKNITIPIGSYQSADTGNVIIGLAFTPEDGKFIETKDYLGNLKIGTNDYENTDLQLSSASSLTDTINAISNKLASNLSAANKYSDKNLEAANTYTNNEIEKLDYSDEVVSQNFVTAVSEENGKIKVSRAKLVVDDIPSLTHNKISDWATEVTNKLSALKTELITNINTRALQSDLDTHVSSNIHITPEERTAWNAKLDSIPNTYIQTTSTFTVNSDENNKNKNIQQLCEYIDKLAERIKTLEDNSTTTG